MNILCLWWGLVSRSQPSTRYDLVPRSCWSLLLQHFAEHKARTVFSAFLGTFWFPQLGRSWLPQFLSVYFVYRLKRCAFQRRTGQPPQNLYLTSTNVSLSELTGFLPLFRLEQLPCPHLSSVCPENQTIRMASEFHRGWVSHNFFLEWYNIFLVRQPDSDCILEKNTCSIRFTDSSILVFGYVFSSHII